jgi:MoaD family protein
MARVRLFASVREAAGRSHDELPGATVADVLDAAVARYGDEFERLLQQCRVWVNGEQVAADSPVGDEDEVAVLPPVSGG